MSDEYLNISCQPNRFWTAPIVRKLQGSSNRALQERAAQLRDSPLRDLQLAVEIKLRMVSDVATRFDRTLQELNARLKSDVDKLSSFINQEDSAYQLQDRDLPYQVLLDLDAFFFETRSAYEILGKFLRELFERILDKRISEDSLKHKLEEWGVDTRWIDDLRQNRIELFHNMAPWFFVTRTPSHGSSFFPVVMKRCTAEWGDSGDRIEFKTLCEIHEGFKGSMHTLLSAILAEIDQLEHEN
jgi:hypothetical protein